MNHAFRDVDGDLVVRDRDGTLRAVEEAESDPLPAFSATRRCEEHDIYLARSCPSCWSEVLGGDRPRRFVGRVFVPTSEVEP